MPKRTWRASASPDGLCPTAADSAEPPSRLACRPGQGPETQTVLRRSDLGGRLVGLLPLCYVRSLLFGRFLVSLPYLNTGGVLADDEEIAMALIDRAVELADRLKVRHLELRHEKPIEHPALTQTLTTKVHMRLALPSASERLWKDFDPKVRNQIRKGEKAGLTVHWGSRELLGEFYAVLRGTCAISARPSSAVSSLIASCWSLPATRNCAWCGREPPDRGGPARTRSRHDRGPDASSLRSHNANNANMFMYWHLLQRVIARGQGVFDFGRSSRDSNTFRFKKQWGAEPDQPRGSITFARAARATCGGRAASTTDGPRLGRLPLPVTRWIGPSIVRGIP